MEAAGPLGTPLGLAQRMQGIPWQSSDWGSELSLPRAWLQSLVQELSSCELREVVMDREAWRAAIHARRGSQGASRAAPGKSGLHARGEGPTKSFCQVLHWALSLCYPLSALSLWFSFFFTGGW